MPRILTGIQSSKTPHLGNILGAILPAIEQSKKPGNESFLFIADMHALISEKNPKEIKESTISVAATWLACGLDVQKTLFYRQSRVSQVTELAWYLNCFAPYPMLANAHSFKDKSERLSDVNGGLFTYPVLMAADIVLYDADFVPVGKDQMQHLEMTADIAKSFNHRMGKNIFTIPQPLVDTKVMIVPGTDGQKMSKSYHNFINVFWPEKELKKIVMGIKTDSTPVELPKNPDTCVVFKLYSLMASAAETEVMRQNYLKGGYGYGNAKTALFELILKRFEKERESYNHWINHPEQLEKELTLGEIKANKMANEKLKLVREICGYH